MEAIETQQYIKTPNEIKRKIQTADVITMHKKNTPSSASEYQPSNVSPTLTRREERAREAYMKENQEKKREERRHERNSSAPEGMKNDYTANPDAIQSYTIQ